MICASSLTRFVLDMGFSGSLGFFGSMQKEFRLAAEQGHAHSQFRVGDMYMSGDGVAKNDTEAVKWFRKAAEQGLANAQGMLGIMYAKGQAVPQDYVLA
jgi:TPR repeat protein